MRNWGDLAICSPSMETARSVGKHIYKLKTKLFFKYENRKKQNRKFV
jgi:hypothetical protein